MHPTDPDSPSERDRTRRAVLAGGVGSLAALSGWLSPRESRSPDRALSPNARRPADLEPRSSAETASRTAPLRVQVPPTLSGAIDRAAGLWNANPPTSAESLLGTSLGAGAGSGERLADHFAGRAGLDAFSGRVTPPFRVATAHGDADRVAAGLLDGTVDLGGVDAGPGPRAPDPAAPFGDRATAVVGHPVAREGWVFVVSPDLADAGVEALTPDQIRGLVGGELTNWRAVGGPDREPFVFLGPDVAGVTLPYEAFLLAGDPAPRSPDARYGRADRLVAAAAARDDALGVVPAGGVWLAHERGVPTPDVVIDGRRRSIDDGGYPTLEDVYLYTVGAPDPRARAFLDLLTSPFGRRELVGRDVPTAGR